MNVDFGEHYRDNDNEKFKSIIILCAAGGDTLHLHTLMSLTNKISHAFAAGIAFFHIIRMLYIKIYQFHD